MRGESVRSVPNGAADGQREARPAGNQNRNQNSICIRSLSRIKRTFFEVPYSVLAKEANVGVFNRFAVMRHWREHAGIPLATFLSPDELHMNDWSYACVAKLLADAIAEAVGRATLSADALSPKR